MEQLHNEFHIPYYAQYVYKIENNKKEYLITFKTYNKLELSGKLPNSTILHVKNGCLFSINALNKLIDKKNIDKKVPNNEYVIDWNEYKDKLIIITGGNFTIDNISKIDDKCCFLS